MKRKILFLLLLGLSVLLTACNQKNFTGTRVANPDSYRLDIEQMNGIDTHLMELEKGDVLGIRFETEKGSLYMEIISDNGEILYAGGGNGITDFTVNIHKSGVHTVHIEAHHAKGKIHIRKEEKTQ